MLPIFENYKIYPTVIPADTPVEMTIVPGGRAFYFRDGEEYKLTLASVNGDEDYYHDAHSLKKFTVKAQGGVLRFKTDNAGLFDFSLEEFEAMGLKMRDLTRDLHNSPLNEGNVMTEYEKAWSEKGYPIHAVTVKFKE